MVTKTSCRWLRFVAVLTLPSLSAWSSSPQSDIGRARPALIISMYNEAGVTEEMLRQGEEEASRVFQRAGIDVHWLNCKVPAANEEESRRCREAIFPDHLHVRIVRKSLGLKGEAMGMSFQSADGTGCYADLFYEPMEELHKSEAADVARLLGRVAAHEIGHLLLGTNSHAVAGIMRARWTAEELAGRKAEMVFLDKESRQMKARLRAGMQVSKRETSTLAARAAD